jgi:CDP-diacylglycerol--glycerol-3-phosphate 3-phosphatidyltransferase
MDPLADKFMVIGAMMVILYKNLTAAEPNRIFGILFFCALLIVVFRELAVTAMRLVVSGSSGIVVAANMLGKIKTCTQIACVILCIVEPLIYRIPALSGLKAYLPLSMISTAAMAFFTLLSGINYIKSYWKYMDPQK